MAKPPKNAEHTDRPTRNLWNRARNHPLWRLETALVTGAIFAGLTSGVLSHHKEEANRDQMSRLYKSQKILVAAKDLPAGSTLDEINLTQADFLAANVSRNAVPGKSRGLVVGHKLAVDLMQGDPLLLSMVQGAGEAKGIAEKIPPGKRLFTLTIDNKSAGYGFVNPNDHVDILAHVELPTRGLTSFTLLEDVTLVSVGARSILNESGRSNGTDVSFFVTPHQFELLAFAQKRGHFSLSLRNPRDLGRLTQKGTNRTGIDIDRFLDHNLINDASGGGALEVTVDGQTVRKMAPKAGKDRS